MFRRAFLEEFVLEDGSQIGDKDQVKLVRFEPDLLALFEFVLLGNQDLANSYRPVKVHIHLDVKLEAVVQVVLETKTVVDQQKRIGAISVAKPSLITGLPWLSRLIHEGNVSLFLAFGILHQEILIYLGRQ